MPRYCQSLPFLITACLIVFSLSIAGQSTPASASHLGKQFAASSTATITQPSQLATNPASTPDFTKTLAVTPTDSVTESIYPVTNSDFMIADAALPFKFLINVTGTPTVDFELYRISPVDLLDFRRLVERRGVLLVAEPPDPFGRSHQRRR